MDENIIRVLIVDDSKAVGKFLTDVLSSDPAIKVVGHALDPFEARDMIKTMRPDVLTLDVEMPRMDGITFLKNLMRLRPMPVVMLSSLTAAGAEVTLNALSIGAVDFLVKRHPGGGDELNEYAQEIVTVVKNAVKAKLGAVSNQRLATFTHPDFNGWIQKVKINGRVNSNISRVVAIGASTGGPEAIRQVLENLKAADCAVVLSQHMPKRFMGPFAARLDSISSFSFAEAGHNEKLLPGHGYVAPGDQHLQFRRKNDDIISCLSDAPKCNGHRPAVDVMFRSLCDTVGASSIGVLLTGMGNDGANGMKAMHDIGCLNIVQDERSSAVWGMPGRAVGLGAVDAELGLCDIGPALEKILGAQS
ncbi:MAG: chemotaxis response regulator protein-glutamate methylesterase [Gammaproteobacteria bacterium]